MAYDLKKLNVASLDFNNIKSSLISFFKKQDDISDLDYDNPASAISMLINILATATAYNGVYAQYGYLNTFASTCTNLNGLLGIASNSQVLLEPTKTAKTTRTITTGGITLEAYSTFTATTTKGSEIYFFNKNKILPNTSVTESLYSGLVYSYNEYDYNTKSIEIPYTIDPETVTFTVTDTYTNTTELWTEVTNISKVTTTNNKHYVIKNSNLGYVVTTNLPTAMDITTRYRVTVTGIQSNGSVGNSAVINARSDISFGTTNSPAGGYDLLDLKQAKNRLNFKATGYERCVTINDYKNAILASNISGTDDLTKITVTSGLPGEVKIYVTGLSVSGQTSLMAYLADKAPAGIKITYSL